MADCGSHEVLRDAIGLIHVRPSVHNRDFDRDGFVFATSVAASRIEGGKSW